MGYENGADPRPFFYRLDVNETVGNQENWKYEDAHQYKEPPPGAENDRTGQENNGEQRRIEALVHADGQSSGFIAEFVGSAIIGRR